MPKPKHNINALFCSNCNDSGENREGRTCKHCKSRKALQKSENNRAIGHANVKTSIRRPSFVSEEISTSVLPLG